MRNSTPPSPFHSSFRTPFSQSSYSLRSSGPISIFTTKSQIYSSKVEPINPSRVSKFCEWKTKWVTDWWAMELVCWLIAALSLLGIVVTLESHRNQPVPNWPFDITINSLISILATIGQMAMMQPVVECISQLKWLWFLRRERISRFQAFDDATRGPTGSLALLGKLGGLHLVSLGAAITVVAVAFGPFAQQVVIYSLILKPTGIATVPQVLFYNSTSGISTGNPAMTAAGVQGFAQAKANLSTVPPFCSTGNCTWPQYSSLGVCANVKDISSTIISNDCDIMSFEKIFKIAGFINPGYPCFNYSLPELGSANFLLKSADNITLSNGNPEMSITNGGGWMQSLTLTSALHSAPSLFTSYVLYQPDLLASINSSLSSPQAYQLNLDLCVQTYNSITWNGITNTTMLSSQILPIDSTVSIGNDTFGITKEGLSSLTGCIKSLFVDSCFVTIPGSQADNLLIEKDKEIYCETDAGMPFISDMSSNSTNHLSAITKSMENVATSLTNAFRTGAGGDAQIVAFNGTSFTPLVFAKANYLWLLFPITLVCLTLVFLLATISKSERLGSRVWKSSNLATLQGIHPDLRTKLGGLSSISGMEEKAKDLEVRFDMKSGVPQDGVEYSLVESKQDASGRT